MEIKTARTLRIWLLVIASLVFICGLVQIHEENERAQGDCTLIDVEVVGKKCSSKPSDYGTEYSMEFAFEFDNSTPSDWTYLEVTTYVYDKKGSALGTLTSTFGFSSSTAMVLLEDGGSAVLTSTFEETYPDDFYTTLYESDLADLRFEASVTYGSYRED